MPKAFLWSGQLSDSRQHIVIATIRPWNIERAQVFASQHPNIRVTLMHSPEELIPEAMDVLSPDFVLFPHWSWVIPAGIYDNFECIVFHMTDLPYGRGGSPLQNLILDGKRETKISALRVTAGLDEGPVYMKRPLMLDGSAEEIFDRASAIIFDDMIPAILEQCIIPVPQQGEAHTFARRSPAMSALPFADDLEKLHDFIRMLDAPDYPHAFLDFGSWRLEFTQAQLNGTNLMARACFVPRPLGHENQEATER